MLPEQRSVWSWLFPALLFVAALFVSSSFEDPMLRGAGSTISWILLMGTGLELLLYLFDGLLSRAVYFRRQWREADGITPRLLQLRAASSLTPDQAKAAGAGDVPEPTLGMRRLITGGWAYTLHTRGGDVPLEFVHDFLRDCGVIHLRPINSYNADTPGRANAQAFTDWLVDYGFAVPHAGNQPAMWATDQAKAMVIKAFDMEISPDSPRMWNGEAEQGFEEESE